MSEDLRTLTLLDWLENDLLLNVKSFQPASSDASFRRYFRVTSDEGTFIVMDAPPEKENIPAFIHVAHLFADAGVKTPTIFQENIDDGFLLLEDFGSQAFLDVVNASNADVLYHLAMDSLLTLQTRTNIDSSHLPSYDAALLKRELTIFTDWFIEQLLDIELPEGWFNNVETLLIDSALSQPITCVHRDYHSRNLMVIDNNHLGVLDFQDAVLGPVTYDLVSLLRDCYIAWPQNQVSQWLTAYHQRLLQAACISCDLPQFHCWFDLMGLQRHLKAIGIFSRLHLRDGKSNYLQDIPRTLGHVLTVTSAYPELATFDRIIRQTLQPAFQTLMEKRRLETL